MIKAGITFVIFKMGVYIVAVLIKGLISAKIAVGFAKALYGSVLIDL